MKNDDDVYGGIKDTSIVADNTDQETARRNVTIIKVPFGLGEQEAARNWGRMN